MMTMMMMMMMMILANVALPAPSLYESKVPARHAGTGDRLIPNLFVKPGAETLAIMNYVSTPMASSAAFKKLDQERESALEEQKTSEPSSQVQVQPSNPNASSTGPLPSNKGRRGVKKSKAKAKTAAKASCEVEDPIVDMMDIKNWTSMAYPLVSDTGSADLNRHKTALDDFLNIFHALVDRHLPSKKGDDVQSQLQPATTKPLFQHGMSIFLEFVWSGSAAINGKFARAYTTFRSEIITFITTALEIAGGQGGSGTRVSISTRLSDLIGEDMPTIGFGLGNSKLEDESDESRAIQRIKMSVDALQNPSSGFPSFAADVLPLPLDYHEKFNAVIWLWISLAVSFYFVASTSDFSWPHPDPLIILILDQCLQLSMYKYMLQHFPILSLVK